MEHELLERKLSEQKRITQFLGVGILCTAITSSIVLPIVVYQANKKMMKSVLDGMRLLLDIAEDAAK